jgi:NAD(P)-dependent dehydrogenase (short-subunit alcohol dehydrogenase family)
MSNPVIVVVGAGPGVGGAVARRFGREGYDVALLARTPERLEALGHELQAEGITTGWTPCDLTDDAALTETVSRFGEHAGRIDVLHYNPSTFRQQDPLHLRVGDLLADVHLGAAGLLTAVQAARPFMSTGGRITATGSIAADRPWHEAASLGIQKAALRNLVRSIDATLAPDGIRAVSVTVTGTLDEGEAFTAGRVADAIFRAAARAAEEWSSEVRYSG